MLTVRYYRSLQDIDAPGNYLQLNPTTATKEEFCPTYESDKCLDKKTSDFISVLPSGGQNADSKNPTAVTLEHSDTVSFCFIL